MEMEKRIVIAMSLCMIVYMLFMYNQMNALKKSCGDEYTSIGKRFDENEELTTNIHTKLQNLQIVPAPEETEE